MDLLIYILLVALLAASAFFSSMETALFALSPVRIRRLRESDPRLALSLERVTADRRRLLSVILFSDVLANVPLVLLCLYLADTLPQMPLLPVWTKAMILFGLVVLICDIIPKMLALARPLHLVRPAIRYLDVALPLLGPITNILGKATDRLADWITPKKMLPRDTLSEGEFATLVQLGAESGTIDSQEREIISEIMKLADKSASDCMTPRVDSFTLPDDWTNERVARELRIKRRRHVPVYGETPDEILGILDVQAFLTQPSVHYTEALIPPSFVPETMNALELLKSFLHHRQRLAIVLDEFGGMEGVVSLSDIVEEVISDAVPLGADFYIEEVGVDTLLVSGQARLDDLAERLPRPLLFEGVDTIGGLIFNQMGHVPRPGTALQIDGYRLRIRRATKRRVQEVLIEMSPGKEET